MELRVFTKNDWMGFAGCEAQNPMIAEGKVDGYDATFIADRNCVGVYFGEDGCYLLDVSNILDACAVLMGMSSHISRRFLRVLKFEKIH